MNVRTKSGTLEPMRLRVVFFRSNNGREPVREWLQDLDRTSKKIIGDDIKTVQYGWPLGMPLVRGLGEGLWEVRSRLPDGIARTIFLAQDDLMILVHGFIKKSPKIPQQELETARKRAAAVQQGAKE